MTSTSGKSVTTHIHTRTHTHTHTHRERERERESSYCHKCYAFQLRYSGVACIRRWRRPIADIDLFLPHGIICKCRFWTTVRETVRTILFDRCLAVCPVLSRSPPPKKGHSISSQFSAHVCMAKRLDGSRCHLVGR